MLLLPPQLRRSLRCAVAESAPPSAALVYQRHRGADTGIMNETQVDTGIAELSGLTLGGRKLVFLDCARI